MLRVIHRPGIVRAKEMNPCVKPHWLLRILQKSYCRSLINSYQYSGPIFPIPLEYRLQHHIAQLHLQMILVIIQASIPPRLNSHAEPIFLDRAIPFCFTAAQYGQAYSRTALSISSSNPTALLHPFAHKRIFSHVGLC